MADDLKGAELLAFYGTECPHCIKMEPLIERLEQETGKKVKRLEVWHNAQNAEIFEKIDDGFCGGVPFFFNVKTKQKLCGAQSYDALKKWALGK